MQIKQVSMKWLQQINYSSYAGRWRYKQRTNMAVVEYKKWMSPTGNTGSCPGNMQLSKLTFRLGLGIFWSPY